MPALHASSKVVKGGEIQTTFDLEKADPPFVLESLSGIIEAAAEALNVTPAELVRDLYSIVTQRVK